MLNSLFKRIGLIIIFFIFVVKACLSQSKDTAAPTVQAKNEESELIRKIRTIAANEAQASIEKYKQGHISIRQQTLIKEILKTITQAQAYLKKVPDTTSLSRGLHQIRNDFTIVQNGVFTNQHPFQTHRNLTVSASILSRLLDFSVSRKQHLDTYVNNLIGFRDRIDSLNSDTVLYTLPPDSANVMMYLKRLVVIAKEIGPVDTALTVTLQRLVVLQNRVDAQLLELRAAATEIESARSHLSNEMLSRELPNLWKVSSTGSTLKETIALSYTKEKLALQFYPRENRVKMFCVAVLILAFAAYLNTLKKRLKQDADQTEPLILYYPFLSALTIVLCLFQFIFLNPPFIFNFFVWLLATVGLTVILKKYVTKYWFGFWLTTTVFFVLASANNLIVQASHAERWIMLGLSCCGILYSFFSLLNGHRIELREKRIIYFIAFVAVTETFAVVFNIFGRYNLSKSFLTIGFIGVLIAIMFLWTIHLLNDGLKLFSKVHQQSSSKLRYINFTRLDGEVPSLVYALLAIGWFILLAKNFYEYRLIADPFNEFLTAERVIGDYRFSLDSLFTFFLIIGCSFILSYVVSLFSAQPDVVIVNRKKSNRVGVGSWILLIRIVIISLGLYLSVAAAGIPLDKLTIVLGALGVGIGLGLQGLVSNLVSGLIIAFEKPVNVGDIIEIEGKIGTMKSIGFRSSVVTMIDGASIIIPNGTLLSKELVNWSTGKNIRMITITVGVAYGSDLQKVESVLRSILKDDERILSYPPSLVLVKAFNQSAIDFDVMFWVRDIRESLVTKSDVIAKIDYAFKENNIAIPFQQMDLYIKSMQNGIVKGGEENSAV